MRRIGLFIAPTEENDAESLARITAFRQGLEALGWTEGRNIWIDYRFGGGDVARIKTYAAELVNAEPDVIVAKQLSGHCGAETRYKHHPDRLRRSQRSGGSGLHRKLSAPWR
jgi:hypothetical protein